METAVASTAPHSLGGRQARDSHLCTSAVHAAYQRYPLALQIQKMSCKRGLNIHFLGAKDHLDPSLRQYQVGCPAAPA